MHKFRKRYKGCLAKYNVKKAPQWFADYITVNLMVKKLSRNISSISICEGNNHTLPSGIIVNIAGIYNDTLHYASGCDSVINSINLAVQKLIRQTSAVSICEGERYTLPSQKVVSIPGIYIDTVRYSSGCDSLISTITISLKTTTRTFAATTICSGQSFTLPSGLAVSSTGIYRDTHYVILQVATA